MNEPAVFQDSTSSETEARGMPVHNKHYTNSGLEFEHKWIHNTYGSLQH